MLFLHQYEPLLIRSAGFTVMFVVRPNSPVQRRVADRQQRIRVTRPHPY